MVFIGGKSLLIQLLIVVIVASFSHVKAFDFGDLLPDFTLPDLEDLSLPDLDWARDTPYLDKPIPYVPYPVMSDYSPPPPSPSPPSPPPPPPSPPPPRQSPPPPPPPTDSFFIPPFLIPTIIDPPPVIPLLPAIPSITNPTQSSQLSPPLFKSPPSPPQCKPTPPDKFAKHLTPPPPAKQPPPPAKQPPPPPPRAPSPSPARQPTPPPIKPPSPSPARQPTLPPVKAPSPSPPPPPPPSKKSPPPAPPPSIANPPVMAPSPSPAVQPPVIIAPFPSPVAKPPIIPRRPAKPILPPALPTAKTLTVNGVVYCKPCNSYGVPNLLNASPLQGASAKLVCYNGKNAIVQSAITDKNGEFRITPKSLIGADIGKCKVYLVKSPNPTCNVPTNFNGGKTGALLQHAVPPKPPIITPAVVVLPVQPPMSDLYGVGPFIFEASSKIPCAVHKKL